MPAVSDKQFRAMAAAASGKSTLGIPKSVGSEFIKEGKPEGDKSGPWHKGKYPRKGRHPWKG